MHAPFWLNSLHPIPTPKFDHEMQYGGGNGLKRKLYVPLQPAMSFDFGSHRSHSCSVDHAPSPNKKKSKSSPLYKTSNSSSSSSLALDPNDYAALNRRAQRFQREHEIERKKALFGQANGNGNSRSHSSPRMSTPDDPEGDPVRACSCRVPPFRVRS